MSLLQMEPQAPEPDLQQRDESEVGPNDCLLATGQNIHQQGLYFQRVPSSLQLQQRPLFELPGRSPEQKEVQIPGETHEEDPLAHLLVLPGSLGRLKFKATEGRQPVFTEQQQVAKFCCSLSLGAEKHLHVGSHSNGRNSCWRLPNGVPR